MAASVTYTTWGGEVIKENRGGTKRGYVPDPLGSTAALIDDTGEITDEWTYWPYGEVASHKGTSTTPFTFVGTLGYFKDLVSNLTYVRARFYQALISQWMTLDPVWPRSKGFEYCESNPSIQVDPLGLQAVYRGCVSYLCAHADVILKLLDLIGFKNLPKEILSWLEGLKILTEEAAKTYIQDWLLSLVKCNVDDCIKSALSKNPFGLGWLVSILCGYFKGNKQHDYCARLHCPEWNEGDLSKCEACCAMFTIEVVRNKCKDRCGQQC